MEWTNLVTVYLRAHESHSQRTILGDHAAAEAVDRIDYDFKRIHRTSLPASNQYLVALRAKQLDDWSSDFLAGHPDAVVAHLGCGLDGRAFRIAHRRDVWFDIDQPGVIELRRRLYPDSPDTDHYRMIGSSVTDPQWLEQIPTGHPTLVVAEGLLMFLWETDVRQLIERLTARSDSGEMLFDTLPPIAPRMSKLFTKGITKWGIRDARDMEKWNPRSQIPRADVRAVGLPEDPIGASAIDLPGAAANAPTTCSTASNTGSNACIRGRACAECRGCRRVEVQTRTRRRGS